MGDARRNVFQFHGHVLRYRYQIPLQASDAVVADTRYHDA